MKIQKFTFNPFLENTYLLWDETTNETVVIDPGCYGESEENEIDDFIKKWNLIPKYLINTHCHIDHLLGVPFIKEKYNPLYLIPEEDLTLFNNAGSQAEMFDVDLQELPKPDDYITEQKELRVGRTLPRFIFTPGHSPGGYCIYIPESKILISGDVLFDRSIGRTDLWGGNYDQLISSVKNKLLPLNDDVIVYPGHGENTTIGKERRFNPFLSNTG